MCIPGDYYQPQPQYTYYPAVNWNIPARVPYKCPVCDGKGRLQYDPDNPFNTTSTDKADWTCKVCVGGIIWSY